MLVSVLGVVAAACGDDGKTGQLADAPPSIDARIIDGAPGIDGPAIDGPTIDSPPPGVTVTVTLGGVPAPGVIVYFQSQDSATTATVATGADGVATSEVEAGGFVTVVDPLPLEQGVIGPTAHLATFAAVQPGDHLFRDVPVLPVQGASVQFTVSVPNEELGYDYTLHSTCGSAAIGRGDPPQVPDQARKRKRSAIAAVPVSNTVELFGCGARTDLLVVGTDSEGGVHSWQYQPDVALVADGTVTFSSYESVVDQSYSYTALEGTSRVVVSRELRTAHGSLYTANADVFFDGTSGSTTIPMPTPDGAIAITTSTDELFQGNSQANIIEWGANTDYTLDIPAIKLHAYVDPPVVDVATHAVTWTDQIDGQPAQLTIASMQIGRTDDNGPHTWTWNLVAPWHDGNAAFPVLPTTLFDFNPAINDEPFVLRLTTAKVPGGYDAARPRVFAGDLEGGVAGASGQIVFEDLFINRPQLRPRTAPRGVRRVAAPRTVAPRAAPRAR
jgi:hypothetical protein